VDGKRNDESSVQDSLNNKLLLENSALILGEALDLPVSVPRDGRVEFTVENDWADKREEKSQDHDPDEKSLSSFGDHVSSLTVVEHVLTGLFNKASLGQCEGASIERFKVWLESAGLTGPHTRGEPTRLGLSDTRS
jgi:hypothetical protein